MMNTTNIIQHNYAIIELVKNNLKRGYISSRKAIDVANGCINEINCLTPVKSRLNYIRTTNDIYNM